MAVAKDMSKEVPPGDPAGRQSGLEAQTGDLGVSRAHEAVAKVRAEVDKLSEKVASLETDLRSGSWVDDKELVALTEMLMVQLLELDATEADGEARVERRVEVCRVQSIVETLDRLKARNSDPLSGTRNATAADTKSEQIKSQIGVVNAQGSLQSSTRITLDWELFD
ncbi:BAG family molecular chaperone regulator 4-like [Rhodamnia argentea]|uniref:BAG family molecular chaperone regulator 4-like n=1 Tax=Rhodamnia argentea TaxID=178133 RepID=A0A8B8NQG1_9MYRT|nr:BAG family molecular chaperone regulator 4-like [Rhodamnia argentea]